MVHGCGGGAAAEAEYLRWWDCAMVDEERWKGSDEEGMIAARIVYPILNFPYTLAIFVAMFN